MIIRHKCVKMYLLFPPYKLLRLPLNLYHHTKEVFPLGTPSYMSTLRTQRAAVQLCSNNYRITQLSQTSYWKSLWNHILEKWSGPQGRIVLERCYCFSLTELHLFLGLGWNVMRIEKKVDSPLLIHTQNHNLYLVHPTSAYHSCSISCSCGEGSPQQPAFNSSYLLPPSLIHQPSQCPLSQHP